MAQATLQGKTKWFKALGEPRENKFKDGAREWSLQVSVESKDKLMLRQYKVKKPVKFDEEIGDYINLTYPEINNKTKQANPRLVITDAEGNPWPTDKWVGNGSTIEVVVDLDKYEFQKDGELISGCKITPRKIKILDHVEYKKPTGNDTSAKRVDNVNWSQDE